MKNQSKILDGVKKKIGIDVRVAFGIAGENPILWNGYAQADERVPPIDPDYEFDRLVLTEFHALMNSGETGIQIVGHLGTSKSSLVEQYHARLNLPLYVYNAHPRTTQADLIGELQPGTNGKIEFVFGPLGRAAMEGSACLIDESNVMDPSESVALNTLIEGRSVFVKEINGWIHPQDGFKVITTINPRASGYIGRNTQDAAFDDRFAVLRMEYLKSEIEINIIARQLMKDGMMKDIARVLAGKFVEVANTVRNLYMGVSEDATALETTISTRTLKRWVNFFMLFQNVKKAPYQFSPVHFALERAQTFKTSDASRIAIHALVEQVFNEEYATKLHPREE